MNNPIDFVPTVGETLRLNDGQRLRLRPIRPTDRRRIEDCFGRLSPESRYRRFLSTKACLTPRELDFLSQCPDHAHLVLGAVSLDWGLERELVGAVRAVPLAGNPRVAELAIVVADDYQGRGVGSMLLERLLVLAAKAGVERLQAYVLTDNLPMRRLLRRHWGQSPDYRREEEVLVYEFPVRAPQLPPPQSQVWLADWLTTMTLPWLWPWLWPTQVARNS